MLLLFYCLNSTLVLDVTMMHGNKTHVSYRENILVVNVFRSLSKLTFCIEVFISALYGFTGKSYILNES